MANFIIAYRQGGPYKGDDAAGQSATSLQLDFKQPGQHQVGTLLDLIGVRVRISPPGQPGQGGDNNQGDNDGNNNDDGRRSEGGQSSGSQQDGATGPGEPGRGDRAGRGNQGTIVNAAFAEDRSAMQSYLDKMMENLTVTDEPSIAGRLNINQAPRRLLTGIPGLAGTAIDQIIANRDVTLGLQRPEQTHETWLLVDEVVDLDRMKRLMPFITTGGRVYRAQVVGFFDAEGPADRLEVVIDATESPPVVRRRWELKHLGPGYSLDTLGALPQGTP
jgi:hypothetical protein